jgi:apolipoprotein N-acyltransferase
MLSSLVSILQAISLTGSWGLTWYVIFFLATELYFARRDATEHRCLFMILVSFILVVYNLAYFRAPYHNQEFDSANRLVLQALPLVLLYLSLRFAQISFSENSQSSQQMGDRNSSISISQPDSALRHTALS